MSDSTKAPELEASNIGETSPHVEKKTPSKRGRMSFIERAQKESEELVKNMGGTLELEGGRRTRSSARGTPSRAVVTPPPVKKTRKSPASPKATTPRARGRGRKLDSAEIPDPPEQKDSKDRKENLENPTPTSPGNDEIQEKSTEKVETNGPEKSGEIENEKVSEKEKIVETKVQKVEKVQTPEKDNKEIDQVDANLDAVHKPLEEKGKDSITVKENEKSKVVEVVTAPVTETTAATADSPMEVDEQSTQETNAVEEESSAVEQPKLTAEEKPTEIQKKSTPEPMEIDSSSKSSDVIECADVVDKVQSADSSAIEEAKSAVQPQEEIPVSKCLVNMKPVEVEKAGDIVSQSQSNSEENGTTGGVDGNSVTVNLSLANPSVADVKSVEVTTSTGDCKIDIKTGNNLEEPKLADAQLNSSGDAAVTTV